MAYGERLTLSEAYVALTKVGGGDSAERERAAHRLATYLENIDQRVAALEERLAKAQSND